MACNIGINTELCNFAGFELLCKKLKDGRQTCKEYVDLLKQRSQAQENYGKSLVRLAKFTGAKDEIGTLRQSFEGLCSRMGTVGLTHVQASAVLHEEINRVNDFIEGQREQRRKAEEPVRRHQNTLKTLLKNLKEQRRVYEARCREESLLNQQLDSDILQPREMDRLNVKADKARTMADQAEVSYRIAVETLENARQDWEKDTRTTCEVYEQMRNVLERCEVAKDIRLFVHLKNTGADPPPPLQYMQYNEKDGVPDPTLLANTTRMQTPTPQTYSRTHSPTPTPVIKEVVQHTSEDEPVYALPMKKKKKEAAMDSSQLDSDMAQEERSTEQKAGRLYTALYDYDGQGAGEISLMAGQEVTLVREETSGWWTVMTSLGTTGYFPGAYLQPK